MPRAFPSYHTSVQLQFCHLVCICRYELNAHLHAHAAKTYRKSLKFRNCMEIPRKFGLLIWICYFASSYDKQKFVFLMVSSPNKCYIIGHIFRWIIRILKKPTYNCVKVWNFDWKWWTSYWPSWCHRAREHGQNYNTWWRNMPAIEKDSSGQKWQICTSTFSWMGVQAFRKPYRG